MQHIASSYLTLGRYAESIAAFDRALSIRPDSIETRATRGGVYLCWKADTRPLRQTIDASLAQGSDAIVSAADLWFFCALADRDPAAAERALVALGHNPCLGKATIILSHSFGEGLLARMTKDEARARSAFEAARAQQEKIVQAQPDYGPALCVLGLIDAALGRKDLALDEGRRAIALTPLEKDVNIGSHVLQYFAITAASAGEKELALQQLEAGLRAPYVSQTVLSYGAFKAAPLLGPAPRRSALRKNRRFARAERTVKLNHAVLRKGATLVDNMKYWEIIADNLSKAGWSWGCVSAIDSNGRTIWIADAHRDDGKRFVVRADEKLTAFVELESAIHSRGELS